MTASNLSLKGRVMTQSSHFYLQRGGKTFGPFSMPAMQNLARDRKIRPTDLIRVNATGKWTPARLIRGLIPVSPRKEGQPCSPPVLVATEPEQQNEATGRFRAVRNGRPPIQSNYDAEHFQNRPTEVNHTYAVVRAQVGRLIDWLKATYSLNQREREHAQALLQLGIRLMRKSEGDSQLRTQVDDLKRQLDLHPNAEVQRLRNNRLRELAAGWLMSAQRENSDGRLNKKLSDLETQRAHVAKLRGNLLPEESADRMRVAVMAAVAAIVVIGVGAVIHAGEFGLQPGH